MKRHLSDDSDEETMAKRPRIRYRNTVLRRVKQLREELKPVLDNLPTKDPQTTNPTENKEPRKYSQSQLQEIAEWDEYYCPEQVGMSPYLPSNPAKVQLCAHDVTTEQRSFVDMDRIDMAWRNIAGHHCNVRPTSKLEQWLVDHHVPTFSSIPNPWHPCARILLSPPINEDSNSDKHECFIGAFCPVTRRVLCSFGDYSSEYSSIAVPAIGSIVCIDANELFYHSNMVVDNKFDPKTKTFHSFSKIFPLTLSIGSVMNICKTNQT